MKLNGAITLLMSFTQLFLNFYVYPFFVSAERSYFDTIKLQNIKKKY